MEKQVNDIPQMYSEMMILMQMQGVRENSRNGSVLTLPEPLTITVATPTMRVLTDPVRQANPFFHVMEFAWMMAGENTPEWISLFNSRFTEYADSRNLHHMPIIHGAYGQRWAHHFHVDQIKTATEMLKVDTESRRVVLGMWDPSVDLCTDHNDLPCNTHIYLRIVEGALDFTVCNRSNDVIWGMTGANAVHMTFLQELMALEVGVPVGKYRVFTNNAHVYTELPNVDQMLRTRFPVYPNLQSYTHFPLLSGKETMAMFTEDCRVLVEGGSYFETKWVAMVAQPIRNIYLGRKEDTKEIVDWGLGCDEIGAEDWRYACRQWIQQKDGEK